MGTIWVQFSDHQPHSTVPPAKNSQSPIKTFKSVTCPGVEALANPPFPKNANYPSKSKSDRLLGDTPLAGNPAAARVLLPGKGRRLVTVVAPPRANHRKVRLLRSVAPRNEPTRHPIAVVMPDLPGVHAGGVGLEAGR